MRKSVKHLGMSMTQEEHERWHQKHPEISKDQHEAMMKQMGITEKQDKDWHETHGMPSTSIHSDKEPVNTFAIGGGFLSYCVKQGWLLQEGKGRKATYFTTEKGKEELKKFSIEI